MSVSQIISQATHELFRGSGSPAAAAAQKQARWRALAIGLSLAALWFALHQYRGVVHDGRLYVAQALNALYPERFASDLFFRYGSQDSFTIFSPLYKPLIAALGVGSAHYVVTFAGEAAFVSGLAFFVRTLFPDRREALFAFIGAIAVQSGYGGAASFHYDEAFATPRPFAEGLVLTAFSLAFTGRPIRAGVALASAAALHPVMALTGMAGLGLWAALKDLRLLILAAAAAVAGVLLGLCSVPPFARLFEVFDPEWFDVVRQRCVFALLTRWNIDDYLAVAASLGLAVVCLQWKDRTLRSLAIVFSIASLLTMALTFVGGDLGRDVLVINIQSWRAMWLSRLLANIVLGVLVLRARPDSLSRWPLLIAAILSALARLGFFVPALADFLTIAALVLFFVEDRCAIPVPALIRKLVLALFGVAAASPALFAWLLSAKREFAIDCASVLVAGASFGLLIALDRGRLSAARATVAAGLALGAALLLNDRRTEWRRFLEQPGVSDDLAEFVSGDSNLYWNDGSEVLWLKLEKSSFYSCLQGAGAMFYRGTAIDYARRGRALAKLDAPDDRNDPEDACYQQPLRQSDGPVSIEDVRRACHDLPDLDGVVLNVALPGASPRSWASPAARYYVSYEKTKVIETFYKYMCRDLR